MSPVNENYLTNIEDIVETLVNAKDRGTMCSVLIGAGCSVTAGIPTAQGFIDVIKEKYPTKYARANPKTYPNCMSKLSVSEQRALIAEYVDSSKVNWGHIALAQLIKAGYVDRILTTNFDSLIVRACALVGIFPAIYDFASSQDFQPDKVPGQAVFYLHGQRTGFVLMNEDKILDKQSQLLAPVFEDAGRGRVWMVVGYSGENDPVFTHLAKTKNFDNNLYWIGYQENDPGQHVIDHLLSEDKDAYFVKGFDSDSFFVTLARMLDCFPPDFVSKPFSHLENLFNDLTEYTVPRIKAPVNTMWYARNFVREAIEKMEGVQSDVLKGWSDLQGENYEKVLELRTKYADDMHPEVQDLVAWAYNAQGVNLLNNARETTDNEADDLFKQAVEKYTEALKVKPNHAWTFYNWGYTLRVWAQKKEGVDAEKLFKSAVEKYMESDKLLPSDVDILTAWGWAYYSWAIKDNITEDVENLLKMAIKKYKEALKVRDDAYVLSNWTVALEALSKRMEGAEADKLFKQVDERYAEAVKIQPDNVDFYYNWGFTLDRWARTKKGTKADELFKQAGEKFAEAIKIQPDNADAYNWGGIAAMRRFDIVTGKEKQKLFGQAEQLFMKAEEFSPGRSAYNFACLYALNNDSNECLKWLTKSKEHGFLPDRNHLELDSDLDNVKEQQWFKDFIKDLP